MLTIGIYWPWHEICNLVVCEISKASDQPAHTCSVVRAFASCLNIVLSVKLLTVHHLEFLSLKGGCTGSSESTPVKMPHCWKSHVMAQLSQDGHWILLPVWTRVIWVFAGFAYHFVDFIMVFWPAPTDSIIPNGYIWHNICVDSSSKNILYHNLAQTLENLTLLHANHKFAYQSPHLRILISAFVIRSMKSITAELATRNI